MIRTWPCLVRKLGERAFLCPTAERKRANNPLILRLGRNVFDLDLPDHDHSLRWLGIRIRPIAVTLERLVLNLAGHFHHNLDLWQLVELISLCMDFPKPEPEAGPMQ
jgi:hypothetical protein